MELFGTDYLHSQVFWVAVSFAVLMLVMAKHVLPMVNATLDARAIRIKDDLDTAARLKEEAEQALVAYEKQIKAARQEAANLLANARVEAEQLAAQRLKQLDEDLARKQKNAEQHIEQMQTKALQEIREQVADLTLMAVEKILRQQVDAKAAGKITDEVMQEMLN